jgi:uncharacterized protein (UPF0261 family)
MSETASVFVAATLDTKGPEAEFVRDLLSQQGLAVRLVDTGCLGSPQVAADIPREHVYRAAGTTLDEVRRAGDRGAAISHAARGLTQLVQQWNADGQLLGLLGLGGSAGTTIGCTAMQSLPLGIPKVMLSTLASGQVRPYVADKDIVMLNSVVDISGINRISRVVLTAAAGALSGMVAVRLADRTAEPLDERPLIAASMFGVTTACVQAAQALLEQAGYEVLVFHATGNGGQAMESLISDGLISGVLDLTTTELADELVGGNLSAGPDRLTAAGRRGVPQVISVGALDMVNFGPVDSVPSEFAGRKFYEHNATITLMRTTVEENEQLGRQIAEKAAQAIGPTRILLPALGVSAIDCIGQPFDDPSARQALFGAVRSHAAAGHVETLDQHINDEAFATRAVNTLLELMSASSNVPG